MSSHAVAIPLDLTDPTPLKVAARAVHMHAAARTFCRSSALWTRLSEHFDGNIRCFVPLCVSNTIEIHRIFATT